MPRGVPATAAFVFLSSSLGAHRGGGAPCRGPPGGRRAVSKGPCWKSADRCRAESSFQHRAFVFKSQDATCLLCFQTILSGFHLVWPCFRFAFSVRRGSAVSPALGPVPENALDLSGRKEDNKLPASSAPFRSSLVCRGLCERKHHQSF